jgi:hypothetical protein
MLVEIKYVTRHGVEGEIFCLEAKFASREEKENPLVAYKATSNPGMMYLHEAMKEPDADNFVRAMLKEVIDQLGNKNFSIIPWSEVPKGEKILMTVWKMRRKRDIKTRKIKKYKAPLNIDGSRMENGVHYWNTYAQCAPQATDEHPKFLLLRIETADAFEPVAPDARFEDCNGHHWKLLILFSSLEDDTTSKSVVTAPLEQRKASEFVDSVEVCVGPLQLSWNEERVTSKCGWC